MSRIRDSDVERSLAMSDSYIFPDDIYIEHDDCNAARRLTDTHSPFAIT